MAVEPKLLGRILWRRFGYKGGKKWRAAVKRLDRLCAEHARRTMKRSA